MTNVNALRNIKITRTMRIGSFSDIFNFLTILFHIFSFFNKCDRKGSCADLPQYDEIGKLIGWDAINDCQGKICRHKCRCEYRFIHTYGERHVYRQITHVWDGGTDYYTGSNLKKYTKKQSITRRFTAYQSKINLVRQSPSSLDANKSSDRIILNRSAK